MKTLMVVIGVLMAFPCYPFTCESGKLAREGMHKYEVVKNCGPPQSAEKVGFSNTVKGVRVVEEWVYIVKGRGGIKQVYLLQINGVGVVSEIQWIGQTD
jgi:hypothetical protein